jgi:hypothetical protein
MDRNRLYSEKSFSDDDPKTNKPGLSKEIFAYDGKHMSAVRFFFSKNRVVEGMIGNFDNPSGLFPFENPLYYSFLLSPEVQKLSGRLPIRCLPSMLHDKRHVSIINEDLVAVDGIDCILISNGNSIYLDPSKDYSVVKIEDFRVVIDPNGEEREIPLETVTMSDHVDYGNGIWVPHKIDVTYSFGDDSDGRVIIEVKNVEVNKKIGDELFTNIFPDDTVVADAVHNLVYTWSDRPSIEATLKSVVKSKRVWTFQIISLTVGTLLILIWIIIKYRAYLKEKNGE